MAPRSSTLFHFTKSVDVVCSILKNGFWPRYCLEDVQWQGYPGFDFVAFPMVCFCDIPIGRIAEHVAFYGSYGVGLTKDWAVRNGMNPAIYFAANKQLHAAFQGLANAIDHAKDQTLKDAAWDDVRYLLAHSKPTSGRMIVAGQPLAKEFYQESEWRHVPRGNGIKSFIKYDDFQKTGELTQANEDLQQKFAVSFLPGDVKYLFVKDDSDIPVLMNFIQTQMDNLPNADLKILMSRVTSLESLSKDV
jgi:hypothetical protein